MAPDLNVPSGDTSLRDQVVADLKSYADDKGISLRETIKNISSKKDISIRALERIISDSTKATPGITTLIKVYGYLYNTDAVIELVGKVPEQVAKAIDDKFIKDKSFVCGSIDKNKSLFEQLSTDRVFNSIYIMTAGDFGTTIEHVRNEHGRVGLEMLDTMLELGLVKIDSDDKITRLSSIFWSPKVRANILSSVALNIFRVDENGSGSNYCGVFLGEVTLSDRDKIYNCIRNNYDQICKILKDSKPTQDDCFKLIVGGLMENFPNCSQNSNGGELC